MPAAAESSEAKPKSSVACGGAAGASISRQERMKAGFMVEAEQFPRRHHMRRQGCGHFHPPPIRVRDIDLAGREMKLVGNGAFAPRGLGAVFEIADDGRPQARQMHADLMRAAGDGL